jgi:hypothetical protein
MPWHELNFEIREGKFTAVSVPKRTRVVDPRPVEFIVVARPQRGAIYWFGHQVKAPFELRVAFRAGTESTFVATYVDSLPLYIWYRPE